MKSGFMKQNMALGLIPKELSQRHGVHRGHGGKLEICSFLCVLRELCASVRLIPLFVLFVIAAIMLVACNNFFHDLVPPDGDRVTSFSVPGQAKAAVISDNAISVTVKEGTNVRGLVPEIVVSPGAKALPMTFNYMQAAFPNADVLREAMGLYSSDDPPAYVEGLIRRNRDFAVPGLELPIDFSAPVSLFVISAQGGIRQYTVYVAVESASNGGPGEGAEWPKLLGLYFSKADNPGLSGDALGWIFEDSRTVTASVKYPPGSAFSYALIPLFAIQGERLEVDGVEIISGQSIIQFDAEPGRQTKTLTVWRDGNSASYALSVSFSEDAGTNGPMLTGLRFAKYDNPELVIDAVCRINETSQTLSVRAFYPVEMPSLSFALVPSFDIFGERLEVEGAEVYSADENSVIQFARALGTQSKALTVWRNGAAKDYTLVITFEEDPDTVRSITDFRFVKQDNSNIAANAVASIINTDNTGAVTVQAFYSGARPSVLIPRFVSPGTVSVSGVTQVTGASSHDFSAPVEYRVISRNGQYSRTYTVKTEFVNLADAAPQISSFRFSQSLNSGLVRDSEGEIREDTGFIIINAYYGGTFAPELLMPEFSAGGLVQVMGSVQVSAASPQDFSRPIQYTVIHPVNQLLRRDYWVQANLIQDTSAYAVISEFSFHPADNPGLKDELKARIDQATGKISIFAPIGSGVTSRTMYPRFTAAGQVSVGGVAQTSGASGQMFSGPVAYTVVSANGLNQRSYTVEVRELTSTMYVNQNAYGAGDGTSWDDAFRYLQTACEAAAEFPEDVPVEIWIASGTYTPGNAADDYFPLSDNTSYIGGFAGHETAKGQRNVAANAVSISGNLGGGVHSKRLFSTDTELGGGLSFEDLRMSGARGSGIHALLGAAAEVAVNGCDFSDLEASGANAAVYVRGGGALVSNSAFNACVGGSVYVQGTSARISDVDFSYCNNGNALALDCSGETEITRVSVSDYSGTAVYLGGNGDKTLDTLNFIRGQNGLSVQNTAGDIRAQAIGLQDLSGTGLSLNGANGVKHFSGLSGRGIVGNALSCTNAASGLFTLTGGNFDNTGAISVSGASVTVLNTGITNSKAVSALAITANGNTVIDWVTIDGVPNGRGIGLTANGSAAISNTVIKNCVTPSNSYGGGMYVTGSGSAGISNVTISRCETYSMGGGIYLSCPGDVFISNTTIDGAGLTASSGNGGGIYRTGGSLRVENTSIKNISGNGNYCAGIYHEASADLVINTLELQNISGYGIYNNGGGVKNLSNVTATNIGGAYGVYSASMASGSFTLVDGKFNSCAVYSSATGTVAMQITDTDILNAPGTQGLYLASGDVITVDRITVDGVPAGRGIYIAANGSAVISNTVIKDCILATAITDGGGLYISGSGSAHISNTAISGCQAGHYGGGIYIPASVNVEISNTLIDNCKANVGGGIYLTDGSLLLDNSRIKNCSSRAIGGGVHMGEGNFTMKGGEISGNTANTFGGGVYFSSKGTLTMEGGKISDNTANNVGGIDVSGGGNFTMKGGEISRNTATGYAGGVCLGANGTLTMEGGEISDNTADRGGGVFMFDGTFTMKGGQIYGNTTLTYGGGGVSVQAGTFTMKGGQIYGNTVTNYVGGGVIVSNGGTFTMEGGEIYGNKASGIYGGGVYISNSSFNKTGGIIYGSDGGIYANTANNYGYAVCATITGTIKRKDTTAGVGVNLGFIYNGTTATFSGGWDY